jgi:hypothetical protein
MQLHQQGTVSTWSQVCELPSQENTQFPSVSQGRPETEDARSLQHPLWMQSGPHLAKGPFNWHQVEEAPATCPSTPNSDTWIASSGRWVRMSSIPTVWTGRMASVWASDGNLSSAPWKIVRSLHHMTADLGSLRGHAGLCTLPLSGHKLCPLRALTGLHPDVPASFYNLWSLIPHMTTTHSLNFSSLHVGSLPNTPLHFNLS